MGGAGSASWSAAFGLVVFVALTVLGVPFPLPWALWVALVDFPVAGALQVIARELWQITGRPEGAKA